MLPYAVCAIVLCCDCVSLYYTVGSGIAVYNKAASALAVTFENHTLANVSTGYLTKAPNTAATTATTGSTSSNSSNSNSSMACTAVDAAKLCPAGLGAINAPIALFIRSGTRREILPSALLMERNDHLPRQARDKL